jgi:hypothetical protein
LDFLIRASTPQPADFYCNEFLPGQHRLEDPIHSLAQPNQQRHDIESVPGAGALQFATANRSTWGI